MLIKKVTISAKYLDFINIFFKKVKYKATSALDINKYTTDLGLNKELLYKLIYNFEFIKLKTLKTYIKTNSTNSFI